jgi:NAD(P)-dependent dehydrogenase (short-subunit alcohol dehydrogenase family)
VVTGAAIVSPTALVTGASRGIGAAIAHRLAADGHAVLLAARKREALDKVAASVVEDGGVALAVATDITDPGAIDELVDTTRAFIGPGGQLDVLVNNAGVLPHATRAERMSLDDWHTTVTLNVTSPWYLATRAHPLMRAGAVVVNISSSAAFYPSVGLSAYNASKAALNMVTRSLALEWARDGIRVVAVAPGKVDTDLVAPIMQWVERTDQAPNVLGRIGRPEEVADLIAYLVSDRATYMTGSIITIDGGELLTAGSELAR